MLRDFVNKFDFHVSEAAKPFVFRDQAREVKNSIGRLLPALKQSKTLKRVYVDLSILPQEARALFDQLPLTGSAGRSIVSEATPLWLDPESALKECERVARFKGVVDDFGADFFSVGEYNL